VFDEELGACVPNDMVCAEGTHFLDGKCVPDTSDCGPGTHLDGGQCVPDQLPPADVLESSDPTGKVDFDLPDEGKSITLGGTVGTPVDGDGDSYVDPDYDRFGFTAEAGTWLRIHATSEGAAHPAFAVVSNEVDAQGYALYARYAVNPLGVDTEREFYLPRSGTYTLVVSDYSHVAADLFGWLSLPVGGDDFTYYITVENLGDPTPVALSSVPVSKAGKAAPGGLTFFELTDLQVHDVRVVRNMGKPSGQANSDVFGALMLFAPSGALLRENLAYSTAGDATILFAATSAGDHLVVVDHLLGVGPMADYELRAEQVATVDCGSTDCSAGTLAQGTSKLLSWDVTEGMVFAVGATVPDTAAETLQVQMMDAGLVPFGTMSSASKYGPAKLRTYVQEDQRLYLLLNGYNGAAIPTYGLDVRMPLVDVLTSGAVHAGLMVHEMPAGTYPSTGLGRFQASAGQIVLSTGFGTTWPGWSDPVEGYMSLGFEDLPGALDVSDPAFPNSAIQPLMAFMPSAGQYLYQTKDGGGGDIVGSTYDTTFHALTPSVLGSPTPGNPVEKTGQSLVATAGWAVYEFSVPKGQVLTLSLTPQGAALLQPEVWIGTPGRRQYASGAHSWVSDAAETGLGVLARDAALAPGEVVEVTHEAPYDGVQLVFVRNVGAGDPLGLFDMSLAAN
jgi:hypothetical protein